MNAQYTFIGDQRRKTDTPHPDAPDHPEPYVAAPDLVRAVNLASYLRRPLLLEGEAGCGKTRLARAVAYELGLPYYPWYVRSTSKAQEGLYSYDSILRLHDVQVDQLVTRDPAAASATQDQPHAQRDPRDPRHYRTLGPLGKAFALRDRAAVVLIDEIDKADIDFPNDLLAVLDDPWSFEISETGERIAAAEQYKPIVIITSNKEKGHLPAPFLRRCIYYYVDFPDTPERLQMIVDTHYQRREVEPPAAEQSARAIQRFIQLRQEGGLHKKPGTSEFLDWLEALRYFKHPLDTAKPLAEPGALPFPELLFKLQPDWLKFTKAR